MQINENGNKVINGLLEFLYIFAAWEEIKTIDVSQMLNHAPRNKENFTIEPWWWTDNGIRCIVILDGMMQEVFLQTSHHRRLQKKLEELQNSTTLRRAA